MEQTNQHRAKTRRVQVRYAAAAAVAVSGLSASVFAAGTAGAVTGHSAKSVVVSTVKNKKLGTILVSGNTLYTLKASNAACTAKCLLTWPELLLPKGVTKAAAGAGVSAAKLGTMKRAGGLQVTYSGKALYYFSKDKAPGQVNGDVKDTWGTWTVFATVKPASSGGSSGSGGTSGTGGVAF